MRKKKSLNSYNVYGDDDDGKNNWNKTRES